jgi:hexosaminidase
MRGRVYLTLFTFVALAGPLLSLNAIAKNADPQVAASWRLVGNQADSRFAAQLKLRNDSTESLPADWALYFNACSKLLPESFPSELKLAHVNGDLYVLRPNERSKPINPGATVQINYEGSPWAINISDAPSGFYLVPSEQSGQPSKPVSVPLTVEPFPTATNLQRGAADLVPVVTDEARYIENEKLSTLPAEQLVKVVPTPVEITSLTGSVRLRRSTSIFADAPLANDAAFLADALSELLTEKVRVHQSRPTSSTSDKIRLTMDAAKVAEALRRQKISEAYILSVNPQEGIEIIGSDPAGVFYGIQTLRAILPIDSYGKKSDEIAVEATRIVDAPRFQYRGLHLDVARNFQSKQTVKKLLDLMAFYKLNRFHWHLTDDEGWRIEIKKLPELSEIGGRRGHDPDETRSLIPSYGSGPSSESATSSGNGFYTQDDLVEILRYANTRHITVIPELDLPGHARAAVKAMDARQSKQRPVGDSNATDGFLLQDPDDASKYESVQMWRDNVVDVGRDATYRFVNTVVDELASVYRRAGVPLKCIHLGGDEVPDGVWEKSPSCEDLRQNAKAGIPRRAQLEIHFLNRASKILADHAVQPACWEDCLLIDSGNDPDAANTRRAAGKPAPIAYVWNNVVGWGREDAAYRLANAGFDVVLCNATHLYFDLACEKDPLEPGYYWAGFVGMRAPFEFIPFDVFKNATHNGMGQPVTPAALADRARLTEAGRQHVLGIQGQLWGENLRSSENLEYMAFPRVMALSERAWAQSPKWAEVDDPPARRAAIDLDWNQFANRLGQRELPRLDYLCGGVHYRLPPPGIAIRDGRVHANVAFPGLVIRYSIKGADRDSSAAAYHGPISANSSVEMRSFDTRGRSSRPSFARPGVD